MTTVAVFPSLRGTVGLWTSTIEGVPATDVGNVARQVEDLGFTSLFIPEAWGREAFTSAQLLLSETKRLVIATGIANIWARDAVSASNAAKTLSAASHGRFILGLGVSHAPLVERMRGHQYEKPVATMRAYLDAMANAPMFAPEGREEVPILLAALGPAMLRLSATHAHGALPYLVTPEHTAQARSLLGDAFLAVEQAVVVGGTRAEYLRLAHAHLEIYTGLENYRANWRRLGFHDDDFVRGGSERLCEAMVLHGDSDDIARGVEHHFEQGADHVCLQVLSEELRTVPMKEWTALSAALSPRLFN